MTRTLEIAYWDGQKKYFSAAKGHFQGLLKGIGDVKLTPISSLEDPIVQSSDLVLTTADHVDEADFPQWLEGLSQRFQKNHLIWVPAIILAELPVDLLKDLIHKTVSSNWYFDIVSPNSLDSLPLRMANLIRIHDHLKELNHYDLELNSLSARLAKLEGQLPISEK